jgi:hypothetical protein
MVAGGRSYPGSSRREDRHSEWEKNNPKQAITAKGKFAQGTRSAPKMRGYAKDNARNRFGNPRGK